MTASDIKDIILRFLDGSIGPYEWDDLLHKKLSEPLSRVIAFCNDVPIIHPPANEHEYCSVEGRAKLRELVSLLDGPEQPLLNWLNKTSG